MYPSLKYLIEVFLNVIITRLNSVRNCFSAITGIWDYCEIYSFIELEILFNLTLRYFDYIIQHFYKKYL